MSEKKGNQIFVNSYLLWSTSVLSGWSRSPKREPRNASWVRRPNPEDKINSKSKDRKNDHRTINVKKLYSFEPNVQPIFHLVNFEALIEKVKFCSFINQLD